MEEEIYEQGESAEKIYIHLSGLAVDMDIFGWGESERQVGREAHTAPYSMQVQALWSKAVTDWIAASRRDVDTARMAATGGSGGFLSCS